MSDQIPLINGRSYAFADISVNMHGRTLEGILAINYDVKVKKTNNHGRGKKVVSRGYGNEDPEASITVEMKEVEALQQALPAGKKITDIAPFTITVVFLNDANTLITHQLLMTEYTNNPREAKQGQESIEVKLDLIVGDILYS